MNDNWLSEEVDGEEPEPRDLAADEWLRLQPPRGGDFLSPGEPEADDPQGFLEALNDDNSPKTIYPTIAQGTPEKYVEAIKALRRILPHQRMFIRALVQSGGRTGEALRLVNARFQKTLKAATVNRWWLNRDFAVALDATRDFYLGTTGVDPQGVMLRAVEVYDQAMQPAPILHQGRATGFYEQDRGVAMRAVEFMGRANGMTREDVGTRVTVQIVNMSSRKEKEATIDG